MEVPVATLLLGLSFLASMLTATLGIGGGIAMLIAFTYTLPLAALIPVHGLVQMGSNVGRSVVQRQHIRRDIALPFAAWAIVGATCAAFVFVELPGQVLLAALGTFILVTTWVKIPALSILSGPKLAVGSFVSAFLSFFVGATGPLVAALLRQSVPDRFERVATHAALMSVQHFLKIPAFLALGFYFQPWLPFVGAMIAAGFLGTLVGTRLLGSISSAAFERGFKVLLTALALDILRRAVWST
jgi:uncharacterized membrane protein YfcA